MFVSGVSSIERLRNENKDKMKTQMTQSFNQYSENETKIWRQNILTQFNRVSSSRLRSHFVISLMYNVIMHYLNSFVMLNQKLDFSFFESLTCKIDVFLNPFRSFNSHSGLSPSRQLLKITELFGVP